MLFVTSQLTDLGKSLLHVKGQALLDFPQFHCRHMYFFKRQGKYTHRLFPF